MQSLDAVLKGEKPVVEQPKPEATEREAPAVEAKPEAEATKAERERDEQGRFKAKQEAEAKAKEEAPKVEKKAEPTPAEKPQKEAQDPPHVPVKALQEERKKRQELERRLAEIERSRQQIQRPTLDPVKDPHGYAELVAKEAETRAWDRILNFSESNARRSYGEELVSEAQESFKEAMQSDPGLYQKLLAQPDPYEFVVKWHKREKFTREVQDPDEWVKAQREALRKELEAEYAQKQQATARPAPSAPPPSLAAATSTGRITSESTWDGPTPLDKLLRR